MDSTQYSKMEYTEIALHFIHDIEHAVHASKHSSSWKAAKQTILLRAVGEHTRRAPLQTKDSQDFFEGSAH